MIWEPKKQPMRSFLGIPTLRQHTLAHQNRWFFRSKSGPSLHSGGMQNDKKQGKHLEVKNERLAIFLLKYSILNFGWFCL